MRRCHKTYVATAIATISCRRTQTDPCNRKQSCKELLMTARTAIQNLDILDKIGGPSPLLNDVLPHSRVMPNTVLTFVIIAFTSPTRPSFIETGFPAHFINTCPPWPTGYQSKFYNRWYTCHQHIPSNKISMVSKV